MKKVYRIFIALIAALMVLSSCTQGDVIDTETDTEIIESIAETTAEIVGGTEKEEPTSPPWIEITIDSGVLVREVTIDIEGDGEEINIVQITDPHFDEINAQDRAENNSLVMKSSNDSRVHWVETKAKDNLEKCLNYAKSIETDQLVVTGDLISFLSYGNLETIKNYIFDPFPDVLACLGNHDVNRDWLCSADESATLNERLALIQSYWPHDIYYKSKVLKNKVMVIQLENSVAGGYGEFWAVQEQLLRDDLATARQNGYSVLLFYHIPLSTGNVKYFNTKALNIGDKNNASVNFYSQGINSSTKGVSGNIYNLIVNNGDIIKGTFCGHKHCDFYTEINAKTADGKATVIPQYVLMGVPYGSGHALRIKLK